MASDKSQQVQSNTEMEITLGLLNAVHSNSDMSQRSMAKDLGIALGLANNYLKRCIKKGLIKATQVPANRYAYYLTPKGFTEKSQLTARYLTMSFDFFRHARNHCTDVFDFCIAHGLKRIGLVGTSDLAEIAILCARDHAIEFAGFIDPHSDATSFAGLPVYTDTAAMGEVDAYVIVDLSAPQDAFDRMKQSVRSELILSPKLLNISRADNPRRAK
jgi:DNA-binding MarR family transcriptional regulator